MNRWPPQGGYKLTLLHHVRGHDPPARHALRLDAVEYRYFEEAAFPAELPDFSMNGWQELAFDGDAAHLSSATQAGIMEAIGCRMANERIGIPGARRVIERGFVLLSRAASYLPSATGNRPDHPARREPEAAAQRLTIDFTLAEELFDVITRNHNATPNEACGGLTPLQKLRELSLQGELYRHPLDALGANGLWRLLPRYEARLNRVTHKGRLGPLYIELYGARYTSPELARDEELAQLKCADVHLYVEEDARFAIAVTGNGKRVLGRVAISGQHGRTPHTLEWRRAHVQFVRQQRANHRAVSSHTMLGFLGGLSKLAKTDDKAAVLLAGALKFMNRYGAGESAPIGGTQEELDELKEAVSTISLDEDEDVELPGELDMGVVEASNARRRSVRGFSF